jgi:FkbM family methyltransferase
MNLFELLRRTANRAGIDICRVGHQRLGRLLDVDLVQLSPPDGPIFDVGANTGRAARWFSRVFPGRQIWSFEPGKKAFDLLATAPDLQHVKKFNLALSDQDGAALLNVFQGSDLNSLLPRGASAERYLDPESISQRGAEQVQTIRLDTFCRQQQVSRIALLKIDTQGFELHVLRGAEQLLNAGGVEVIQLEVNFSPLYQGQPTLSSLYDFISRFGFGLIGLYDVSRDRNGCLKWCDAVFKLNRENPASPG